MPADALTVADLVRAVEMIAPPALAEPWDNTGLLLGDRNASLAGGVMLTIDLTAAVMDEVAGVGASAVLAYHPPIFEPVRRVTSDTATGRVLLAAARAGIAVYSPHTALDAANGGMTDWLADAVLPEHAQAGAGDRRALIQRSVPDPRQSHKIVTFVPAEHVEHVRNAMASAGAGIIGAYDVCSFSAAGKGSFRAGEGASPAIGKPGGLNVVDEVRLEMVCSGAASALIIETIRAFHPYEEPAIDVYRLEHKPLRGAGAGRRVVLDQPVSLVDLARRVEKRLGVRVRVAEAHTRVSAAAGGVSGPVGASLVRSVGLCPGAGASLLEPAIDLGCEVFVTGEMKHHEVLGALARGCSVILAGHTNTERGYLPSLAATLRAMLPGAAVRVSERDADPIRLL